MEVNHCLRSISLPSRSHPLAQRFDEELNKLKSWETTSSLRPTVTALHEGLEVLVSLYGSIKNLLLMPQVQNVLSRHINEKWVAEEVDGSVRLMDMCACSREAMSLIKESAQDLQSTLRMRGPSDPILESKIHAYMKSRRTADKEFKTCLRTLKQMEEGSSLYPQLSQHQELSLIVSALKEARLTTITIYRSIFTSFSKQKTTGWSLVSKTMRKGRTTSDEESCSELEKVDASLSQMCKKSIIKDIDVKKVQNQLKGLEVGIAGVEIDLQSVFQRLIQKRVSLLNIFSS